MTGHFDRGEHPSSHVLQVTSKALTKQQGSEKIALVQAESLWQVAKFPTHNKKRRTAITGIVF